MTDEIQDRLKEYVKLSYANYDLAKMFNDSKTFHMFIMLL